MMENTVGFGLCCRRLPS